MGKYFCGIPINAWWSTLRTSRNGDRRIDNPLSIWLCGMVLHSWICQRLWECTAQLTKSWNLTENTSPWRSGRLPSVPPPVPTPGYASSASTPWTESDRHHPPKTAALAHLSMKAKTTFLVQAQRRVKDLFSWMIYPSWRDLWRKSLLCVLAWDFAALLAGLGKDPPFFPL